METGWRLPLIIMWRGVEPRPAFNLSDLYDVHNRYNLLDLLDLYDLYNLYDPPDLYKLYNLYDLPDVPCR